MDTAAVFTIDVVSGASSSVVCDQHAVHCHGSVYSTYDLLSSLLSTPGKPGLCAVSIAIHCYYSLCKDYVLRMHGCTGSIMAIKEAVLAILSLLYSSPYSTL